MINHSREPATCLLVIAYLSILAIVCAGMVPQVDGDSRVPSQRGDGGSTEGSANTGQRFGALDFVIDEHMFQALCARLQLDAEQRTAASVFHTEYMNWALTFGLTLDVDVREAGLAESNELRHRALKEFRRSAEFNANPGPIPSDLIPWEQILAAYNRYMPVLINGLKEGDAGVARFYASLSDLLTEEQQESFPETRRLMRRLNFERAYCESMRYLASQDFVPEHAEPHRLLDEAVKESAIIELLLQASDDVGSDVKDEERLREIHSARKELREALHAYDLHLDQVIRGLLANNRRIPLYDDVADFADRDELEEKVRQDWIAKYRAIHDCNMQIATILAEHFGAPHGSEWIRRYQRAFCPSLTKPRAPDYCIKWIEARSDTTPQQIDAAEQLFERYSTQYDSLLNLAITAGVQMHQSTMSSGGRYESARIGYNKHVRAIWRLVESTLDSFRALLARPQVEQFERDLLDQIDNEGNLRGPTFRAN
jgi:hypothetical protein